MLHRIRLAMQQGSIEKLSGQVEADENFIVVGPATCTRISGQRRFRGAGFVG